MNNREFKRAALNRQIKERWRREHKGLIWFTRILFVAAIALLLTGGFGYIVEENIASDEEYEAWNGSFWDMALNTCVIVGAVTLAMAIIVSLVFIRGARNG